MRLKLHKERITSRNCRINANGCEWSQFIQQMLAKLSLHPQRGKKCWISSNDKVKETQLRWHKLLISSGNPASATFSLRVILEVFPSVLSRGLCFLNELYFHFYCSIQKNLMVDDNHINQRFPNPVLMSRARFSVLPERKKAFSKEYRKCVYLGGQKNRFVSRLDWRFAILWILRPLKGLWCNIWSNKICFKAVSKADKRKKRLCGKNIPFFF